MHYRTNGISVKDGLTDSDWEVVQVIKAILRTAKKTAVVTIAEKLNTTQKIRIADLNSIDYIITELSAENPVLLSYQGTDRPLII
jgi:DeoR/GlpR family transcriptional regulator of sugar metabolism